MKVSIVGVGPGNPALLTAQAREAIAQSELLVGAPRLLDAFADTNIPCQHAASPVQIAARLEQSGVQSAAVLVSGDVGFYSAAKKLRSLLDGHAVTCCCGVSSLQYFAAQICTPWEDIVTVSLHGRAGDPVGAVRAHRRVFFLTGGETRVQGVCRALTDAGLGDLQGWAGERLSYPDERILSASVAELAVERFDSLAVFLVENPVPAPVAGVPGLPDGAFLRGDVPMTKSEVRAVILAKLRPCNGEILYDVGAGTGSVAVELALQNPAGVVCAVERNPAACALIAQNKARFALKNLQVTQGTAPDALAPLAPPDAAFIGGSSGNLAEIVAVLLQKNSAVRLVISAVTLETISEAMSCAARFALADVEIVQLAVSRAEPVGQYHMLRAQNPITILSARGKGQ